MQPDISVLIAVDNHADILPVLLSSFERQTFASARFEIVVSGPSRAGAALERARRFACGSPVRITCLESPIPGDTAAVNLASKSARGRLLLLFCPLLLPGPQCVERHMATHSGAQGPTCVFGGLAAHPALRPGILTPWFLPEECPPPSGNIMPAARWRAHNASLPRALFAELGGLDETLPPDAAAMDFGLRAARLDLRTVIDPKARGHAWCESRLAEERRRLYLEGRALARLIAGRDPAGLAGHYHLQSPRWLRLRDRILVPYYLRAAEDAPQDLRAFSLTYRRILRNERRAGFAHATAGVPPAWSDAPEQPPLPAVPQDAVQDLD